MSGATGPNTIVRVLGTKEFESIRAEHLSLDYLNDHPVPQPPTRPIQPNTFRNAATGEHVVTLSGDVAAASVQIGAVNGLAWRELQKAAEFTKNPVINGDLILTKPVSVKKLQVERIDGDFVENLMTKHTDQEVHASVLIKQFHSENIVAHQVNGVNFKEMVALQGQENHIKCKFSENAIFYLKKKKKSLTKYQTSPQKISFFSSSVKTSTDKTKKYD